MSFDRAHLPPCRDDVRRFHRFYTRQIGPSKPVTPNFIPTTKGAAVRGHLPWFRGRLVRPHRPPMVRLSTIITCQAWRRKSMNMRPARVC
jgi:hypothetical protein